MPRGDAKFRGSGHPAADSSPDHQQSLFAETTSGWTADAVHRPSIQAYQGGTGNSIYRINYL